MCREPRLRSLSDVLQAIKALFRLTKDTKTSNLTKLKNNNTLQAYSQHPSRIILGSETLKLIIKRKIITDKIHSQSYHIRDSMKSRLIKVSYMLCDMNKG
jgi:hypothetical protein